MMHSGVWFGYRYRCNGDRGIPIEYSVHSTMPVIFAGPIAP
jgi:hypothetical protein